MKLAGIFAIVVAIEVHVEDTALSSVWLSFCHLCAAIGC
jgi:hypothetical protein